MNVLLARFENPHRAEIERNSLPDPILGARIRLPALWMIARLRFCSLTFAKVFSEHAPYT